MHLTFAPPALVLAALISSASPLQAASTQDGKSLFETRCGICHAAGGFGANILARRLGPERSVLASRTDLTAAYLNVVVRRGLGNMPAFSRVELTDPELQAIGGYLVRPKTSAANLPKTAAVLAR